MAIVAIAGFAQNTGDVIYVYQKDYSILSFLRSEITEFYYGFEDEQGVTHDEPVMQWIVLKDSICKIPLVNIDSISFVTPPTVYQSDVTRIEQDLMQYVESSDSLTIKFAANTPSNLLPKVGEKIATTEMNEKFPIGFMGKVRKVTGTTVECDAVNYQDVLDTYYNVTVTKAATDGNASARNRAIDWSGETRFTLPTWNIDLTPEIKIKVLGMDDLTIKDAINVVASITPEFYIKAALIVNKEQGINFSTDIIGNYDFQEKLGIYGGLEYNHDFKAPDEIVKVPIAYGICFYINLGAFIRASATVSFSAVWSQNFREQWSYRIGSKWKGEPIKSYDFRETNSSFDVKGCLDGSLMAGGFVESGLTFLHSSLDKLTLRGEAGIEAASSFVFLNSEISKAKNQTKYYEMLKNSEIDINYFANTTIQAEVAQLNYTQNTPFNVKYPLFKFDLVPTFYNTEFEQCYAPRTSADARVRAKGNLIEEVNVGFKVFTQKGEEVGTYVFDDHYSKGDHQFGNRFEGLDMKEDYRVYPVVRINDTYDILADPSVELQKNPFPVRIVDFEQTGSKYSKQKGFEYEGRNYFYKFNATTTVELDDEAKNIKDWGYVYHDFYDNHKKISCANLGTRTYADKRYAYYYNEPYRTVELYPYVQYEGETEIEIGKTKVYPVEHKHESSRSCPDGNHPHMIDLGLPSGTKWACCNVDADEPDEYGGYYAWGMTTNEVGVQSPYFEEINGVKSYKDLGPDISGTQYDVAKAKWGGAWCIPSMSDFAELINYTSGKWIPLSSPADGYGAQFTSRNGNCIYLPLTGYLKPDGLEYSDNEYHGMPVRDMSQTYPGGYERAGWAHYYYSLLYWTSNENNNNNINAVAWGLWDSYTHDVFYIDKDHHELGTEIRNIREPYEHNLNGSPASFWYSYGKRYRIPIRPVAKQRK